MEVIFLVFLGWAGTVSESPRVFVDDTAGPGLVGALLVGAAVGRSLAFALGVPSVAVHHMEGRLLAPMLEADAPAFPFLQDGDNQRRTNAGKKQQNKHYKKGSPGRGSCFNQGLPFGMVMLCLQHLNVHTL